MMPGFWVKATIAAAIVGLVVYGTVKLKQKWPGCLTGLIMVVTFLALPIIWAIVYYNVPIYYLEPFKGRVIESGTGNPISGAAVMVKYYEEFPSMVLWSRLIDIKETVTNENGEYYISSEWLLKKGGTPYGRLTIFKPGYSVNRQFLLNFLDTIYWEDYDHRFWNTGYQIYELNQLKTKEERCKNANDIIYGEGDYDDFRYFHKSVEEERRNLNCNN